MDLTVIDRQVYSVLDWLGDIGGLGEACFFLGGGLLVLTQKDQFDSMLVSALYRVKGKNATDDKLKKQQGDTMMESVRQSLKTLDNCEGKVDETFQKQGDTSFKDSSREIIDSK